jgi:predicted secreted hydrolase
VRISERLGLFRMLALGVALLVVPAMPAGEAGWTVARPDYSWSFPQDHWSHPTYKLEWWYFTGHLETDQPPRRAFGYQFTIFRIGLQPHALDYDSAWTASNLLMGHAAITDKQGDRHVFGEVLYRGAELLAGFGEYPEPEIAWSRAPVGTDGRWSLRWNGDGFDFELRDDRQGIALDLTTRPLKPLIFQGPNGYSVKSVTTDAASQYYSMTRLETKGTLSLDGTTYPVNGQSWMDREFSTSNLDDEQIGWDWFSLQLDDGRELMLYVLRRADGSVDFGRGTVVSADGRPRWLSAGEWRVQTTGRWTSPETASDYPAAWVIEVEADGLILDVRPDVAAQENIGRLAGGLCYWEGAVTVFDRAGKRIGQGYVELTGYGDGNRPPV